MDRDLLLVLAGGGLGIAGTLVGSLFSFLLNRKSQRDQWDHDEKDRRAEWERVERDKILRPWTQAEAEGARAMLDRGGKLISVFQRNYEVRAGCFLAGTLVTLADRSSKPIEEVLEGEEVLSYDIGTHSLSTDRVIMLRKASTEEYIVVNQQLKVTRSHHLFAEGIYRKAGDLVLGARLLNSDWQSAEITSIELVRKTVAVYNLDLPEGRGFFVQGLLAHQADEMKEKEDAFLVGNYAIKEAE